MRKINCLFVGAFLIAAGQVFAQEPKPVHVAAGTLDVAKKKVLVVYYSHTGNTRKAARDIATAMNADIEEVIDMEARGSDTLSYLNACKEAAMERPGNIAPVKENPAKYDLVILGTPVWMWNMTPAIRAYVTNNKSAFRNIAVLVTSGSDKPELVTHNIEKIIGKTAVAYTGFIESEIKDKDQSRYQKKLAAFVNDMKQWVSAQENAVKK